MTESTYNVQFVGDYFSMNVVVAGVEGDEEVAIDLANNIMKSHYGWDVLAVSTIDVEATKEES